ncbi:unnamed protein product [Mytilus coruscus]|uniref:PHD-type domain-containing protein n=1 Tax=Mytilus coruscus TaxID=42192 RepID=A0A6J8EDD0_MYTCO|nr:unnamed protein product [Mytilus coruscus]
MSSSENFDDILPSQKIQRTNSEILREIHAVVDISDGEYDSDCSVGVVVDSDDDFGGISDFTEEADEFEDLWVTKIADPQNILTKSKQGEHMFTIINNYNPEYVNHFTIIDNIRTEILTMNERRLVYRKMINNLIYISMILILISNDVNMNPGPECSNTSGTVYPCGTCDQPVTWQERGIVCDTCNQWYHVSCQSMQTKSYLEHVNDSAIAWDCIMCNCPNFSTFCYSLVFSTSNQFSILSNISINSPTPGVIKPLHTSMPERKTKKKKEQDDSNPKTIWVLNVNFQSIRNKQGELINLIESTKPETIFGTETWLDASIKDTQYFPDGYNIYRNDRNLSGGEVLIAVNDAYITSSVPELQTGCEIVWCKMEIIGHKTVYLSKVNLNPRKSIQKPRIIPLYRNANWENMEVDLNNLHVHKDITSMNEQKERVVGSQMPVEMLDSKTDLEQLNVNKIFTKPVTKNSKKDAGEQAMAKDDINPGSSSSQAEIDKLIQEEIETMEREKKGGEQIMWEEQQKGKKTIEQDKVVAKPQVPTSKQKVTRIVVKPAEPTFILTNPKVQVFNDTLNKAENKAKFLKETRVAMVIPRKQNQKSPRKLVNYGSMIQSTTESHRPDTPDLGRGYFKDPFYHEKFKMCMFNNFLVDPRIKPKVATVTDEQITTSTSLDESTSGHETMPSSSSNLPVQSSSLNVTSIQRERFREFYDTIDLGTVPEQRVQTPDPTLTRISFTNRQTTVRALPQIRTAFQEPKKNDIFRIIRKQASRFGRFIADQFSSISCTSVSCTS